MGLKAKLGISFAIIIGVLITSYIDVGSLFISSSQNDLNTTGSPETSSESKTTVLRLGYFPNVNHAQAIIGLKNGDFQRIINDNNRDNITIKEFVFSAGPSAIEALFGGQIDAAYVGPSPAISGFMASGGEGLRIVSGASSGGTVFIVRNDSGINSAADLGDKKFASPQLGNTQDVSLRKYIQDNGYNTVDKGGNVTIMAVKPSDILTLFLKKEIDGAWVPEPWGARLIKEAGGKILIDERDLWPPEGKFVTSNIIVKTDYLKDNPEIVKRLLEAHVNQTQWIKKHLENKDTEESINNITQINPVVEAFNNGLQKVTGKTIPVDELQEAFTRIDFTYDPLTESFNKMAEDARSLGYLGRDKAGGPELANIYDLGLLQEVLKEKNLTIP